TRQERQAGKPDLHGVGAAEQSRGALIETQRLRLTRSYPGLAPIPTPVVQVKSSSLPVRELEATGRKSRRGPRADTHFPNFPGHLCSSNSCGQAIGADTVEEEW